jgi:hypothetical protein
MGNRLLPLIMLAYSCPVKKLLTSFVLLLPIMEILVWAVVVLGPTLILFFRLKHAAQGSGSVSIMGADIQMSISSEHFLSVAFDHAGWAAEKAIITLNASAKFVEVAVSLIVSRTGNWQPKSLLSSTWRSMIYPIYALPAWIYVGHGIDALRGRNRVRTGNMIVSIILTLISGVLCCGLRFGLSADERYGQDRLDCYIIGFALWAILFALPFIAWLRQSAGGVPRADL